MNSIFQNKYFWIALVVLVIFFVAYSFAKDKFQKPKVDPLPNGGQGIPIDGDGKPWNPEPTATVLYDCMFFPESVFSWGTDEERIFATLDPLTDDMVVAVSNAYNTKYYPNGDSSLREDLEGELEGSDLSHALSYFP